MIACGSCGTETVVQETRSTEHHVRRRRACPACGLRVTTVEIVVSQGTGAVRPMDDAMIVRKRDVEEIVRLAGNTLVARFGKDALDALLDDPATVAVEQLEPVTGGTS